MNNLDITSIIFGWILGIVGTIFGTLIIEKIRRCINKRKVNNGIIAELTELETIIVATCFTLTKKYGQFDVEFLRWWRQYFEKIIASDDSSFIFNDKVVYEKILNMDEKDLLIYITKQLETPKSTKLLPKITTPYIDTNLNILSEFGEDYKRQILKIKRQIGVINNDISEIQFYHRKTFDKIESENHDIIITNINKLFGNSSLRTKDITDLITKFIDNYK